MAVTLINPTGLPEIDAYRQVSVATGSKLVFIAGQVSWDAEGVTVGEGDLAAQVEQCYLNVGIALAGAGGCWGRVGEKTPPPGARGPPNKTPRRGGGARGGARPGGGAGPGCAGAPRPVNLCGRAARTTRRPRSRPCRARSRT
ncbi:RidA family protein, partial [Streptomyces yangpuensis]|uniref:RidA family protein n=1 Tax=Streptomyces yangpuensis TaxID=1648182 RepID=UPI00369CD3A8